ncbi:MAG: membrane-bound lytic murein transglycosylase MltF [Cellvibrionaceae bacterium]|nr:membrane-bound lytic murein transglycosylase MltF [Cellvibrionaceae bacterium]
MRFTRGTIFSALLRTAKNLSFVCLLTALVSGLQASRIPTELEKIYASGKIVVISRNGPTTYYEGPNGNTGLEYVLAKRFADFLGVELEIRETEDLGEMLEEVKAEQGHLAASGLTVTERRKMRVRFSEPYMQITQKLLYRASTEKPRSIEDLYGKKILVIANSSHSERLKQIQREHPELDWQERSDVEMLDLMEMVHSGEIDHTIVDSNAYDLNTSVFPRALVGFDISEPQDLAWAFSRSKDSSLFNQAEKFFHSIKTQGYLDEAMETFYGHLGEIGYSGALVFAKRLDSRLPKWRSELQAAAEKHDLDWQMLAALSYQESHWNPKAKSPTGVRGFMMLTNDTAKYMGIKNRLDPKQSIAGGAKFFRYLYNRLDEEIQEPDRLWFTMAAYNVGLGHVEDARIIAKDQDRDPNKWADVREVLPLLAKRAYYKHTKHGYARGWEPVEYVRNIRNFQSIIAWNEVQKERTQLSLNNQNQQFLEFSKVMTEAVKIISTESL